MVFPGNRLRWRFVFRFVAGRALRNNTCKGAGPAGLARGAGELGCSSLWAAPKLRCSSEVTQFRPGGWVSVCLTLVSPWVWGTSEKGAYTRQRKLFLGRDSVVSHQWATRWVAGEISAFGPEGGDLGYTFRQPIYHYKSHFRETRKGSVCCWLYAVSWTWISGVQLRRGAFGPTCGTHTFGMGSSYLCHAPEMPGQVFWHLGLLSFCLQIGWQAGHTTHLTKFPWFMGNS